MFCPHCSQQQVSEDVRFCSRCGFPLDGVAQLLANGGIMPAALAAMEPAPPSPRRKGFRQGALIWFVGMLVVPLLILMVEEFDLIPESVAMTAAFLIFMGGLARMVYALFFEDGPLRRPKLSALTASHAPVVPPQFVGGWRRDASALPPPQGVAANAYVPPRPDTAEIVQRPPSVTEETTRLLDDQRRR